MPYRMQDDSVTVPGKGRPDYVGKSITRRGEDMRQDQGVEPGRFDIGEEGGPDKQAGRSTARDVTSVRPLDPVSPTMPNLR